MGVHGFLVPGESATGRTHRGDYVQVYGPGTPRLLVFVPAAFTPICSSEVCEIADLVPRAAHLGVRICVVSCDGPATLAAWLDKVGLHNDVLGISDHWPHGELANHVGAFDEEFGLARRHTWAVRADGERALVATAASGQARSIHDHLAGVSWAAGSSQ